MKNIVVNDEYHQADLKPSNLLAEYIRLLQGDVAQLLAKSPLTAVSCPACASTRSSSHFEKFGLSYQECADCQSLYIASRPSDKAIASFYRQAPSKVFWRNQLSENSRSERKAKIIKPRFEWILDSIAEHLPQASHWVDVHTSQRRYAEAMAVAPFALKTTIYPYTDHVPSTGLQVVDKPWWEAQLSKPADVVSLFEVLDHTSDVNALLSQVKAMLNKGGLCFMTVILASGLDVKELGAQAQNIYPPDRLNVFSVKGLTQLINRHGFECLEFSTPGVLDLDIIAAALRENPQLKVSAFIRDLALNANEEVRRNFSGFLQENLLSSYGRILVRRI